MKSSQPYPIDANATKYLRGEAFSSGLEFPLPGSDPDGFATDRLMYLEGVCRGKRVLHLGCCDHPPLIRQKIAENRWLHGRLTAVAQTCLGLDIDAQAVAMVREQIGHTNVILADLSESVPPEVQAGKPWDILVAGEIVEHLDNPVLFLAGLGRNLKGLCSGIIITVPNAFRDTNFRRLRSGTEFINSDHRYWFTPYTLAKVLTRAGYTPQRFAFVESVVPGHARGVRGAWRQRQLKEYPALREALIMEASFS